MRLWRAFFVMLVLSACPTAFSAEGTEPVSDELYGLMHPERVTIDYYWSDRWGEQHRVKITHDTVEITPSWEIKHPVKGPGEKEPAAVRRAISEDEFRRLLVLLRDSRALEMQRARERYLLAGYLGVLFVAHGKLKITIDEKEFEFGGQGDFVTPMRLRDGDKWRDHTEVLAEFFNALTFLSEQKEYADAFEKGRPRPDAVVQLDLLLTSYRLRGEGKFIFDARLVDTLARIAADPDAETPRRESAARFLLHHVGIPGPREPRRSMDWSAGALKDVPLDAWKTFRVRAEYLPPPLEWTALAKQPGLVESWDVLGNGISSVLHELVGMSVKLDDHSTQSPTLLELLKAFEDAPPGDVRAALQLEIDKLDPNGWRRKSTDELIAAAREYCKNAAKRGDVDDASRKEHTPVEALSDRPGPATRTALLEMAGELPADSKDAQAVLKTLAEISHPDAEDGFVRELIRHAHVIRAAETLRDGLWAGSGMRMRELIFEDLLSETPAVGGDAMDHPFSYFWYDSEEDFDFALKVFPRVVQLAKEIISFNSDPAKKGHDRHLDYCRLRAIDDFFTQAFLPRHDEFQSKVRAQRVRAAITQFKPEDRKALVLSLIHDEGAPAAQEFAQELFETIENPGYLEGMLQLEGAKLATKFLPKESGPRLHGILKNLLARPADTWFMVESKQRQRELILALGELRYEPAGPDILALWKDKPNPRDEEVIASIRLHAPGVIAALKALPKPAEPEYTYDEWLGIALYHEGTPEEFTAAIEQALDDFKQNREGRDATGVLQLLGFTGEFEGPILDSTDPKSKLGLLRAALPRMTAIPTKNKYHFSELYRKITGSDLWVRSQDVETWLKAHPYPPK